MTHAHNGVHGARRSGPACWLAVLALLTLLMSPVLAGRAHAAMSAPHLSTVAGMTDLDGKTGAMAPCHPEGAANCVVACSLASQLLAATSCGLDPDRSPAGRVAYAHRLLNFNEALPERSTPPPR